MTRSTRDVEAVHALQAAGLTTSAIARTSGIPRSTVRDWLGTDAEVLTARRMEHVSEDCSHRSRLSADYAFVLGLYLGDGCLSHQHNGVWKLRLVCDSRYPDLIDEWALAVASVIPRRVGRTSRTGCVELTSHSKHWFCLLPQHAPGKKHERTIALEEWQRRIIDRHPAPFVRGLLFSDGCRVANRVGKYSYGRYFFTNTSDDIRSIACHALRAVGVEPRQSNATNISVARRRDVERLDVLIGFKH